MLQGFAPAAAVHRLTGADPDFRVPVTPPHTLSPFCANPGPTPFVRDIGVVVLGASVVRPGLPEFSRTTTAAAHWHADYAEAR